VDIQLQLLLRHLKPALLMAASLAAAGLPALIAHLRLLAGKVDAGADAFQLAQYFFQPHAQAAQCMPAMGRVTVISLMMDSLPAVYTPKGYVAPCILHCKQKNRRAWPLRLSEAGSDPVAPGKQPDQPDGNAAIKPSTAK
jgi:hypothetical protein